MMLGRTRILKTIKWCGINPNHQVLDDEASQAYKDAIQESGTTYQPVPPGDYWIDISKKTIQTHKDHFIGVLSGIAETFPMYLWYQLIPQEEKNCYYLVNHKQTRKYQAMHTYMVTTTTMQCHLYPQEWRL